MTMTKKMGIIGYPLGHTLSPTIQQAGLNEAGIDATFEAWPTPPAELKGKVEQFRDEYFLGACVTLPHKQDVIELVDDVHKDADELGAVNWILNQNGRLFGHNTDAPGFLRALMEELSFDPNGASALVLGAGGAARAVAFALRSAGVSHLTIANRTQARAEKLASDFNVLDTASCGRLRISSIEMTKDALADVAPYADLIVNTTSVGMTGGPFPDKSPLSADLISTDTVVYDAVYSPVETPLMKETIQAGARGSSGLSMLVYQGVLGFELCTGVEAPASVMMKAAVDATSG